MDMFKHNEKLSFQVVLILNIYIFNPFFQKN